MMSSHRAARILVASILMVMAFGVLALGAIGLEPQANLVGTISANQPTAAAVADAAPADGSAPAPVALPGSSAADATMKAPASSALAGTAPGGTPDPPSGAINDFTLAIAGPAAPSHLVGYRWPLIHGRLTLPFGPTPWGSRIVGGQRFHDGVDLATFCGDRVLAAHDGVVIAASRHFDEQIGWVGDLGPYFSRLDAKKLWETLPIVVITDDGNGYRSVYAHFEKVVVKVGQTVTAGELIGYEGRTGHASGCHVHYGLFSPLDPTLFAIDPAVVKRMKVPAEEVARIDPLLVLPYRPDLGARPSSPPAAAAPE